MQVVASLADGALAGLAAAEAANVHRLAERTGRPRFVVEVVAGNARIASGGANLAATQTACQAGAVAVQVEARLALQASTRSAHNAARSGGRAKGTRART